MLMEKRKKANHLALQQPRDALNCGYMLLNVGESDYDHMDFLWGWAHEKEAILRRQTRPEQA